MAVQGLILSNNKRHRMVSQDKPRKKPRASSSNDIQHGYTTTDIFEFQVDELLASLETEANRNIQKITELLKELKVAIEDIPPREPLLPREAEATLKSTANVATPFPVPPPKDARYTLEYAKPSKINVIGSAASKTLLTRNGQITADLVVIMPAQLLQDKDYRNYRYFHKKAYYTACVAAGVQKADIPGVDYSFSLQNGNSLQPCLVAKRSADGETSIAVKIICVGPDNCFAPNKLYPWLNNFPLGSSSSSNDHDKALGSHFYNSTLRSEILTMTYLALIHKMSREIPSFTKASMLFSVWLHQRRLGSDLFQGGFGSFEAQAMMAVLLHNDPSRGETAIFRTRYNHHQLFKAALIFLSGRDFVKDPIFYNFSLGDSSKDLASQPIQQANKSIVDGESALFFDGSRAHNLFFKVSSWAYARLQRQAELTVKCLNETGQHHFEDCFISKLDNTITCYDQVLTVNFDKLTTPAAPGGESSGRAFGFSKSLHRTLEQALNDRALEMSFGYKIAGDWLVKIERPRSSKTLELKIVVDANQATRLQDLGPPADDKDAAATFRQFWGPKAELRRFKDGSIRETVIWSDGEVESIVTQIIRYALNLHHGDGAKASIQETGDSFWQELRQPVLSKTLTAFEDSFKSFRKLEQLIRDLKMPLAVRQISPIAPGLRYSQLDIDHKHFKAPMPVVVQFESSGQWPDDLGAIQQVKIAFLQKLGDLLSQHDSSIRTRVGLDQQANSLFIRPFLEVVMDALFYHIVIYHDRELFLLKNNQPDKVEDRRLLMSEIQYHNMIFLHAPAHTSRIRDLCTKYPLLSQSIRLFKAWCSAHLLIPHFREELLELFVVYVFTNKGPYGVPSSIRTAFLRVISMLSQWDWHNEPLYVSLSDESDESSLTQLDMHLKAWRKIDPSLSRIALIVGSNIDPTGTVWTESGPSKVIAARLSTLAKAANSLVKKLDLDLHSTQLFTHSTKDYDFIIHLNVKSLKSAGSESSAVVNEYINELERVFGNTVIWFHSGDSQKIIAGLWNPLVESQRWKPNLGYSTIPLMPASSDDGDTSNLMPDVSRNTKGTLNEIVRLGGDLVSKVTVKGDGH